MPAIHVPPKGVYYLTVAKRNAPDNPDYAKLPLRSDEEVKKIVDQIEYHDDYGLDKKELQRDSGINGEVSSLVVV
jgi:hypothetical protein